MLSSNDAYLLICKKWKQKPVILGIREFPKWFGFYLAPPGTKKTGRVFGTPLICVNKVSGEVVEDEDDIPMEELGKRKFK